MDGELETFVKIWLSFFGSLSYCYFVASKIPKGPLRLLSLLPILSLSFILPLFLSSLLLSGITGFFISWLSVFKLILFSFDSGPLASDPPISFPLFLSVASFPVRIKKPAATGSDRPPKLPLNLPAKVLLFAISVALNDHYFKRLTPKVLLWIHCVMLYLFIDILLGFSNVFVRSAIGIELEPPSDEPYLASSLQNFWGRRWNLLVSNTLRWSVYAPARAALERVVGRRWAPAPAVFATFVVSGLMHELLYYYITRASPTWEVTWFFLLHGACVMVEVEVKRALRDRWRLPSVVSGLLTVAFVEATAAWLFFPPLQRSGSIDGVIWECMTAAEFVKGRFVSVFERV